MGKLSSGARLQIHIKMQYWCASNQKVSNIYNQLQLVLLKALLPAILR
jgi:hypothetical protein